MTTTTVGLSRSLLLHLYFYFQLLSLSSIILSFIIHFRSVQTQFILCIHLMCVKYHSSEVPNLVGYIYRYKPLCSYLRLNRQIY